MSIKVTVTKELVNERPVYGICITNSDKEYNFHNLSDDKNAVKQLSKRISDNDIAPQHYNDIVRDFIVGEACDKLICNSLQRQ